MRLVLYDLKVRNDTMMGVDGLKAGVENNYKIIVTASAACINLIAIMILNKVTLYDSWWIYDRSSVPCRIREKVHL